MTSQSPVRVKVLRPEIQALRALAIGGVALVHTWPGILPGGQVGVDVFFVISGFLITGMLLRDWDSTGTVSLARFYARRARRLFPSAVLVLAASAVATAIWVPRSLKDDFLREILASLLYAQNWVLAFFTDPEAADSPMTHFWSLSVEEQFYFAWPLLLILGLVLARRAGTDSRALLGILLGALVLASLAYSVWITAVDVRVAYFSTFSRAWEFGAGGMLALLPAVALRRIPPAVRGVLSWAGVVAIVVTMVTASDHHVFPGWTALVPVAATLAVIAAGSEQPRWGTVWLANAAPVQWTGNISYAFYLWHWPLIAFAPFVTGVPSQWWFVLLLLTLAVLLAWATTRLIEDPIRGATARRTGRQTVVVAQQR
jgi:peptidoglycan/LPS O-acetylase OafA/YrhL